ncbi:Cytosolic sulfotransferase 15 [Hibiscus syriacus]|uniref:Sulfotransferase n=1 Tax=Hibiscus syriacus TaxID=106335 RepID=A0A6A3AGK8_HIBSY|nr:Cytosolic sulfotransferase 15 [Hibiscus syriacus]
MDTTQICKAEFGSAAHDVDNSWDDELQKLEQTLPKEEGWISGMSLYLYQGFWCSGASVRDLKPVISFQKHFKAIDSDVIIVTIPKCGTTWLKALAFSTLYRDRFASDQNPLLTFTPHQLVRFLQYDVYLQNPCPRLEKNCVYKPRAFATHVPYASLPTSIKDSHWVPFTEHEEKQGVVEEIAKICSFEKLKELEVNKKGSHIMGIPHKEFFRKGKVGDWSYLTPSMVERLEKLIHEKMEKSEISKTTSGSSLDDELQKLRHFQAFESDVIIATFPKCGTTWLNALAFSTLYRNQFAMDEHPLLTVNPDQLVRQIEFDVYLNNPCPDLENINVYKPGASLENANKILFLKYEDLKDDISSQLKHLAMFLGVPFTKDEEKQGVVEEIAKICSFERLEELEVNKKGSRIAGVPHKSFFRKGKVGDWSNYFTPSMVERMEDLIQQKFDNSGLTFKLSSYTPKA